MFGNTGMDRFPLLIKIIDAKDDLSIQVHPDDAYAKVHENGSLGKTECWFILDCKEMLRWWSDIMQRRRKSWNR